MNFDSRIFKISIVIALVFMLIPIAAAEDATDSVYAEEQGIEEVNAIETQDDNILAQDQSGDIVGESALEDDLLGDEEDAEDDDYEYDSEYDPFISVPVDDIEESSADLEIKSIVVPQKLKVGDFAIFTFVVTNNGPDTAKNVVAFANVLKGDVLYISHSATQGSYNSYSGFWTIGDLEAGDSVMLMVLGKVVSDAQIVTIAYVISDTPDPDESNNNYSEIINVESEHTVAAESEALPATGNPIVMAFLAILAIVGVTAGRKF